MIPCAGGCKAVAAGLNVSTVATLQDTQAAWRGMRGSLSVYRLRDDRVFAPSPETRRHLARALARLTAAFPMLAWRVVDTHLHLLGRFSEAQVDELTRRLRIFLAGTLHPGVPLLLSRRIPVRDQWHLVEAFGYVLRQDTHHGVGSDPLQEGSCVLDPLGMRLLCPVLPGRVREHLPRVCRGDLLVHVGVGVLEEAVHLEHLADAACAAFALPELKGRSAETVSARVAAVHAASGCSAATIAAALDLSPQTIRRMAAMPPRASAVRAVRLQMSLRAMRPAGEVAFAREREAPAFASWPSSPTVSR